MGNQISSESTADPSWGRSRLTSGSSSKVWTEVLGETPEASTGLRPGLELGSRVCPHMRGYIINERRAEIRGYFTLDLGPESVTQLSGLQLLKLGESSSFFSWSSTKHCLGWKVVISRPLLERSLS